MSLKDAKTVAITPWTSGNTWITLDGINDGAMLAQLCEAVDYIREQMNTGNTPVDWHGVGTEPTAADFAAVTEDVISHQYTLLQQIVDTLHDAANDEWTYAVSGDDNAQKFRWGTSSVEGSAYVSELTETVSTDRYTWQSVIEDIRDAVANFTSQYFDGWEQYTLLLTYYDMDDWTRYESQVIHQNEDAHSFVDDEWILDTNDVLYPGDGNWANEENPCGTSALGEFEGQFATWGGYWNPLTSEHTYPWGNSIYLGVHGSELVDELEPDEDGIIHSGDDDASYCDATSPGGDMSGIGFWWRYMATISGRVKVTVNGASIGGNLYQSVTYTLALEMHGESPPSYTIPSGVDYSATASPTEFTFETGGETFAIDIALELTETPLAESVSLLASQGDYFKIAFLPETWDFNDLPPYGISVWKDDLGKYRTIENA